MHRCGTLREDVSLAVAFRSWRLLVLMPLLPMYLSRRPPTLILLLVKDLRWHLVQPRYIQYSTYNVKLSVSGGEEVIRHDLAVYGARDAEKVINCKCIISIYLFFSQKRPTCLSRGGGSVVGLHQSVILVSFNYAFDQLAALLQR